MRSLEHLFPPVPLCIRPVANLEPCCTVAASDVRRVPVFGDDSFQIMLASKPEERLALALDVGAVKDAGHARAQDTPQLGLAFDQREMPNVPPARGEQIESDEDWFGAMIEQ